MNKIFTLKNILVLFVPLICSYSLKAQNTPPPQKKVILVVRPGSDTTNRQPSVSDTRQDYAPTTAERSGTANYMLPGDAGKTKRRPAEKPKAAAPVKTSYTPPPVAEKAEAVDTTSVIKDISRGDNGKVAFLEVGGPGLALTLNYDSRISGHRDGLGFRIGAGYYNTGANSVFTVPVQLNYLSRIFGESNYAELGIGSTFLHSTGSNKGKTFIFDRVTGFIGTVTIGYRYEPEESRFNFRLDFVPVLYDEGVIAAGGLSVGYTFK